MDNLAVMHVFVTSFLGEILGQGIVQKSGDYGFMLPSEMLRVQIPALPDHTASHFVMNAK